MEKIAVFPGSFDPFTKGHKSIVTRAMPIFDKIIIAIGHNTNKQGFFPLEKRLYWINEVFKNSDKIEVEKFEGLTVNFCKEKNAGYLLRGLRTAADFEYERGIAQINKAMEHNIETLFLLTAPELTSITSTIIQDILRNGGDASQFVPDEVSLK
ncbi:pantetheine-phosphate adenylyltransferase [Bacteroidota bacterium]